MTVKKLNLEQIQDEILDECFDNTIKTLDDIINNDEKIDDDSTDEILTSDPTTFEQIKTVSRENRFVSNEKLIYNIQNGIDVDKSKELIIMYNSGLVYNEAKNCTCNIPFQDKVQYGFEALMKAIYGYNTSFKTQFSTYATTTIRQHMYRNGNNDVRMVALPEYLSVYNIRIQSFIEDYSKENSGYPTHEQISNGTGIDIRSVKRIMNYTNNVMSMDMPVSNSSESEGAQNALKDLLPGVGDDYVVDERCVNPDFLSTIELILDELQEHERVLIGLVHGLDGYKVHTFDEIINTGYIDGNGKYITSKPTLSRRYNAAIDKVRRIVERKEINFD